MFSNMARNKSTTQTATSYSLKANSNPRQANHMSHYIQFLHSTIGNQAVQRMLTRIQNTCLMKLSWPRQKVWKPWKKQHLLF
ncbi:hypothetical protein A8708_23695 [Paenibacillus oryzisoli]|uniref:Uncharacterized protein n=1 Tax=Paenibacillus oryzisoli TaxID=1850517 RepID=A0A198A114_9BACL|nr:hypothetical protein A8708_23695 [Paenibacillus oryzisoli]